MCLVIAKCGAVHFVQTLFQKSCALFRCNIVNLSHAAVFFLETRGNCGKMWRFSGGSNLVFDLFYAKVLDLLTDILSVIKLIQSKEKNLASSNV